MIINANEVIKEMGDIFTTASKNGEPTITISTELARKVWLVMVMSDMEDHEATTFVKEDDRVNHWHCEKCGFVEGCPALEHNYCPNCGRRVRKHG